MPFPRETENSLLLYLLRRISNFPICLPQMGFWKYGNAEDSIDCVPPHILSTICLTRDIHLSFLNLQKFVNDHIAPLMHTCPIHVPLFVSFHIVFFKVCLYSSLLLLFSPNAAWQCLFYPSSSRPLLYCPNKISPSFMVRLTRSHLNRAFVRRALSLHTCSAPESCCSHSSAFVKGIFHCFSWMDLFCIYKVTSF